MVKECLIGANHQWGEHKIFEENTIANESKALRFINKYGFVTLFPVKGMQFPSLYQAIRGSRDEKLEKSWAWGDSMALSKQIHYGKLIRRQVTLVSLEILPYFIRLGGELQLGKTAQRILEYLSNRGKTSTTNLRRELGFSEKEQKREFLRAIDELQMAFAVAIVEREKAPRYTYSYDLMERWMPKSILEKAKVITAKDAREKIVAKMLENAVISEPKQAKRFIRF